MLRVRIQRRFGRANQMRVGSLTKTFVVQKMLLGLCLTGGLLLTCGCDDGTYEQRYIERYDELRYMQQEG